MLDFTHVRNTGAAFGFLNAADFPFKTTLIAAIATAALIGVGLYSASLAAHQRIARIGLALIVGGAAGNLIDRVVTGSVVDFVDVYWRTYHFWAFNVADSAITVGVAIMILDMLGVRSTCIQDCLRFPPSSARADHGLHLRRPAGGGLPAGPEVRHGPGARRATSTQTRVLDLGIYIIISALIGAKLLLLLTNFRSFLDNPRELRVARLVGRRLLRRADSRGRRGTLYIRRVGLPLWTDLRRVRARHRARPRHRALRLLLRRMLLRQADRPCPGASRSPTRSRRSTSARP